MLKWVLIVIGLSSTPAFAQSTCSMQNDAVAFEDGGGFLSAEEEKRKARLEALEAMNKGKQARVIVLKQGDVDATNGVLQKIVKTRIVRPDAEFFHDIDLYQSGRREPNRDLKPNEQRGTVNQADIDEVLQVVDDASTIPWNQLTEAEWGLKAEELRKWGDELWFVDNSKSQRPYSLVQPNWSRCREHEQHLAAVLCGIDRQTVNYYWFGRCHGADPALLSKVTDPDVNDSIKYYKEELDGGGIRKMTLSFEEGGEWDAKEFASEYVLYVNGQEVLIDAADGYTRCHLDA